MDLCPKKTVPKLDREDPDERWVWVSFAPEHRLILATHIGPRTQESAEKLVDITAKRLSNDNLPLFVSDGLKHYEKALLRRYCYIHEFPRTGKPGRPRKPIQLPLPGLNYAQVIKRREKGKVVKVDKRIVFGEENEIPTSDITTSLIERQNLTLRQDNNRLRRKTIGYSKEDIWLHYQNVFYMTYFNLIRSHESLKAPVNEHIKGKVWRKYRKTTPSMSCGITEHRWTLSELLKVHRHKISTG